MQVIPCVNARIVPVIEDKADGVMADGLDIRDPDILFSRDCYLLPRSMPLHFGGRAFNAQEFGGEVGDMTVIKGHKQASPVFPEPDFRGPRRSHGSARHIVEAACFVDQHDRDAVADRVSKLGAV